MDFQQSPMNTNALGIPTLGEEAATTSTDTTTQVSLTTPGGSSVIDWFKSLFSGGSSTPTPAATPSNSLAIPFLTLLLGAGVGYMFWHTIQKKPKRRQHARRAKHKRHIRRRRR